ncbi:MAG: hemolysin III family protein [Candidatus Marinimicrobia bacterium]|nr:hemolysin III family protein [Candidatus Neomarinimicrobiota bacterium]MBT3676745.1 hemolysin III family protein [Candidatus Neomarinimicrobiota bacterium]MBT3762678.1 hemolysin III family protein [Candidatus Neomarinimicrobiota bacterium]MBT4068424.1 hemolysin III family protein [Candidatus Neomarinimicrobiota bacterium]MBT4270967.1 hemolysin III family protein [Candidatus Neomarinimicrobiota bacterium]
MNKILKDPMSGLTHVVGAILSVIGLTLLILEAVDPFDPWKVITFSIFGSGLFLLYTASTLYHWIPVSGRAESILKRFDHMMIYVLIASTYTPICLVPLRGPWGWSLFGIIWGLALFGILWKLFQFKFPEWFSTFYYIFMGWISLIAIWPLILTLQTGALIWLLAGGLFYSGGVIFYSLDRQESPRRGFGYHEIWHLFVLAGSASHFWVMYRYITQFN